MREGSASIDEQLRQAVADKAILGVVVMAADRKGVIYQGAFGSPNGPGSSDDARCDVPHRVDDQSHHLDRRHAARRAEALALEDPVEKYLPAFAKLHGLRIVRRRHRRLPAAAGRQAGHRAALFTHTSGLGYGFTSATCATSSRARASNTRPARCYSSRASGGSTAPAPTGSAGSSRRFPASRSRTTSANASSRRSGWSTPSTTCRTTSRRAWSPSTAGSPTARS